MLTIEPENAKLIVVTGMLMGIRFLKPAPLSVNLELLPMKLLLHVLVNVPSIIGP